MRRCMRMQCARARCVINSDMAKAKRPQLLRPTVLPSQRFTPFFTSAVKCFRGGKVELVMAQRLLSKGLISATNLPRKIIRLSRKTTTEKRRGEVERPNIVLKSLCKRTDRPTVRSLLRHT